MFKQWEGDPQVFDKYLDIVGRIKSSQPIDIRQQYMLYQSHKAHGTKYLYDLRDLTTRKDKAAIYCPLHGVFHQTMKDHIDKIQGCPECKKTKIGDRWRSDKGTFVKSAIQVHGNLYSYDKVEYVSALEKVSIICHTHGEFFQTPQSHTLGRGCPKCQGKNYNIIYILRCLCTGLIKIGITSNLKNRLQSIGGELQVIQQFTVSNPAILERHLHNHFQHNRTSNLHVRSGNTEFFNLTDQELKEALDICLNEAELQNPGIQPN